MSGRSPRWISLQTGLKVGTLPVGSMIKLKELGALVEFYVAEHNYESGLNGSGRTLIVRKDCYDRRAFASSSNAYASSDLDSFFRNSYLKFLDADVRAAIGTTKFYYTIGGGDSTVTTLQRAVFQLSFTELGGAASNMNVEGSALPIADTLEIAYLNGSAVIQWTRTPRAIVDGIVGCFRADGSGGALSLSGRIVAGSRPVFTLPADFRIPADFITAA